MLSHENLKYFLGAAAVLISLTNLVLYIRAIFVEKIKPHALSWLIWSLSMAVVFAAQYSESAGAGAWQTFSGSIGCGIIGILALFYGERKIAFTDWLSFLGAIAAIPLWVITKNPLGSVILLTLIDGLGFYPTVRKSYFRPYEENLAWTFRGCFGYLFAALAMEKIALVTLLYPCSMIVLQTGLGLMILWRRRAKT